MMVQDIKQISDNLKKRADLLLEQTGVIDDLKQFGEVHLGGAYAGNVMWDPDIDITVVRDEEYSAEKALDILRTLYLKGAFRSYFIKGDWEDRRKGKEFPHGHYIGLKQRLDGEKWVVDVWFVSRAEFEQRREQFLDISEKDVSGEERELILACKKYRSEHNLNISGQQIYEAVLNNGASDVETVMNFIK